MNLDQTMAALERAGTEQACKLYARHGAKEPMYGVGYAALYALQKQIGVDQQLAEQLWDSGNHDARVLATLVADGGAMTASRLNRWCRAADNRFLAMAFAAFAARSKVGLACALQWIDGASEFEQAAGWATLAGLATSRAVGDETFAALLPRLQNAMHELSNYARYSANNCLIAIGGRPGLAAAAMAAAKAVGRVEVDHGDTSCKTPVASEYIVKLAKRNAKKAVPAKKAAPAKKKVTKKKAKKQAKGKRRA